jgi:hypothetical protein
MQVPSQAQAAAFGRHVVTYAMGAVSALAVLQVVSPSDAASAGNAISQISSGVASIVAGATTLIGIGSGIYAAATASPLWQMRAAARVPGTTIVTDPAIAAKLPDNVRANTEAGVVSK